MPVLETSVERNVMAYTMTQSKLVPKLSYQRTHSPLPKPRGCGPLLEPVISDECFYPRGTTYVAPQVLVNVNHSELDVLNQSWTINSLQRWMW